MLNYNDIIKVAMDYLEIPNTMTADIAVLEDFTKKIVYPTLCNFTGRNFHLIILDGYCNGINTINSITLPQNASNVDDFYNNYYIEIIEGLLAGTRKKIIDYDATTRIITVDSDFQSIPDASSRFAIMAYNTETFINSQNVFVDNELIFPPAQLTPIKMVLSNEFTMINENIIRLNIENNELYKIYNIIHIYGFFEYLRDVEAIIVMILQDFWKRKGKHGLQGIIQRTINLEDTLVEQNYLKEIFTSSYRIQLAKYMIPYEKRSWS